MYSSSNSRHDELNQVTPEFLAIAAIPIVLRISEYIKSTIEELSLEQKQSLYQNGIALCGEGSNVKGLAKLLSNQIGVKVFTKDYNHHPVIEGLYKTLEHLNLLKAIAKSNT